jgi:hypothetical protein
LKTIREEYPVGNKLYSKEIKVCKKPDRRFYLKAKDKLFINYDRIN